MTSGDGSYLVDGAYYLTQEELEAEPLVYDNVYIDRTDHISSFNLSPGANTDISFNLTPSQVLGEPFENDVEFSMDQYLGYHIVETPTTFFSQSAIYKAGTLIEGVQVKNPGVYTKSDITGDNVYDTGPRDFDVIPNASAGTLKELMRTNAAYLTRDIRACTADVTIDDNIVATDCVRIDNSSKTIVAVYEGDTNDVLTIGAGSDFVLPNYKYTIIVKGGASVLIHDNIVHSSSNGSFGLIVLSDINGEGGNVFIHPNPTNITGLLYAEGSLLSSSDGSTLYYGTTANANDLRNQLFWQGVIMSRNTIGGGANKITPNGVNCDDWGITDPISCAQVFDLDYIRRFVPASITGQPGEGYSPDGITFSGGGSCTSQACSFGAGSLYSSDPDLTTISLINGHINLDDSKSIDSFFVEKINRPIPPGFSVSGGLTQYTEIRN